jgi:hypothetical protein
MVQTWSASPAATAGVSCSYSLSPTWTRSVRTGQQKLSEGELDPDFLEEILRCDDTLEKR